MKEYEKIIRKKTSRGERERERAINEEELRKQKIIIDIAVKCLKRTKKPYESSTGKKHKRKTVSIELLLVIKT